MVRHATLLSVTLLALSSCVANASSNAPRTSSAIELEGLSRTNNQLYARHGGHQDQADQLATTILTGATPAHDHSSAPLTTLNETLILLTHSPDPLAYYELDGMEEGKPSVLVAHVVFMGLAFFVLLPLGESRELVAETDEGANPERVAALFLKSGKSQLALIPQGAFLVTSLLGMLFGAMYGSLTPNLCAFSSTAFQHES